MIATSIATPRAISAAHWAAIFTPPSSTKRASTGSAAKIELRASESDTGSKFCVYTLLLPSWRTRRWRLGLPLLASGETVNGARQPLRHLLQRHALPADGPGDCAPARAVGLRGGLPARADLLRADAHELGLLARGHRAGAALRPRVRRCRAR